MLRIHPDAKPHWLAVKKFARSLGPTMVERLLAQLKFLNSYAEHDNHGAPNVRVTLHTDFAPYSFSILWERRGKDGNWKYWFNGGLIYHGPHDNGGDGGAPTFAVNLSPHHGWSIHT